jgi:hypothetical protein
MAQHRSRGPRKKSEIPVFDPGQKIRDLHGGREGVIVDIARQYSHPNAEPVHNYLVRWDDGTVEALNERAFTSNWGLEVLD